MVVLLVEQRHEPPKKNNRLLCFLCSSSDRTDMLLISTIGFLLLTLEGIVKVQIWRASSVSLVDFVRKKVSQETERTVRQEIHYIDATSTTRKLLMRLAHLKGQTDFYKFGTTLVVPLWDALGVLVLLAHILDFARHCTTVPTRGCAQTDRHPVHFTLALSLLLVCACSISCSLCSKSSLQNPFIKGGPFSLFPLVALFLSRQWYWVLT